MNRVPVVSFTGLNADSLGIYLASLGLFSLATRRWPNVRACWRNARFCLVGGPTTLGDLIVYMSEIGAEGNWSEYQKPWDRHKKLDVKKKNSICTAIWRASKADEKLLPLFGAHLALDGRVRMNPLLGVGGSTGNRIFSNGWKAAINDIKNQSSRENRSRDILNGDLKAFLEGKACTYLKPFQGGSWFGAANKIYNHGTKKPFREGEITPWAMALACEGLVFFAGGPSRQLGSRKQPKGAFPFITEGIAPKNKDEAGRIEAEVWLPLWNRPMTKPELMTLFARGRAEIGSKGATTSVKFSAAILRRGVDGGITEFRRFILLHTTSNQTFESRLENIVLTSKKTEDSAMTRAVQNVIEFRDTLRQDVQTKKKPKFFGLRGPIEQALVDLASSEPGISRAEKSWALVDEMLTTLTKVDRNRTFRKLDTRFQLLPGKWAVSLFHENPPDRETRLALAITSLKRTSEYPQFIVHRIGVCEDGRFWKFPESMPTRCIWSDVGLTENLCAAGERRIMDALRKKANAPLPFAATTFVDLDDVHAWLSGDVDEERISLWINRLCLFDWNVKENREAARLLLHDLGKRDKPVIDGALALYGLFRPLADGKLFDKIRNERGDHSTKSLSCAPFSRIIGLLRRGDLNVAVDVARSAYSSANVFLADIETPIVGPDPVRLLATLIIPSRTEQVLPIFRRWCAPTRLANTT